MPAYAAVDLGATSGRVARGTLEGGRLDIEVVHRFAHRPQPLPGGELVWDYDGIRAGVVAGLHLCRRPGPLRSVGVDGWGVDYGLVDATGALLGPVHSYRSARTDGVMEQVIARLGRQQVYELTGIQFLPFNTAYQLLAEAGSAAYARADRMLMLPDLLNAELAGSRTNDVTNASTTQLLDVATRCWSDELVGRLGLRRDLLPDLHEPGLTLGRLHSGWRDAAGTAVVAVASHDTASAVAAIPFRAGRSAAYVSSGTWSLVGVELGHPVRTPAALAGNVTNELGVAGTVRVLKNVTGLWLLEECRRTWAASGMEIDVAELVREAARVPVGSAVVDPDDPRFASPGDMPGRIRSACRDSGQAVPQTPPEVARVVVDSLALAYRRALRTVLDVAGIEVEAVHVVGGGAANDLLNALTASACGLTVLAGPVEATVIGNLLVQAIAAGQLADLEAGRSLVARTFPPVSFQPDRSTDWAALERRLPVPGVDRGE